MRHFSLTGPYRCKLLATSLLLCALVPGSAAQSTDVRVVATAAAKLRELALHDQIGWDVVRSLTTEVGPRAAGSAGDAAAIKWAVLQLRQRGFANVHSSEVLVPHWIRGLASANVIEPYPAQFATLALGGSVGTPDDGIQATVLAVPDIKALRDLPAAAVAGQIVYFSGHTDRSRDGSGYGRAVRQRAEGPAVAAALGAVGVVIRSISTSNNRLPHTGTTHYNIGAPRIPAVAIPNPDADALERQIDSGRPVMLQLKVTARDLPPVRSANVIADIPGNGQANEIVLLAAHLDSWDPGTGALDDGSGVAIVIAAARLAGQMEPKPRRTIRVVLFANEEFGLSGATRYAADESSHVDKHVLAMEADLGAGPVWRLDANVPETSWPFVRRVQQVLAPLGVSLGANHAGSGSDIGPLRQRGVPLLSPQLDASNYFDVHHSANDTLDKVNPEYLRQAIATYAVAAYLAAIEPTDLGRLATDPAAQMH